MEKGDLVRINYVGRVQESGEIFDLTDEAVAEEESIDEEAVMDPVEVIVGAGQVLPGLDAALADMEVGEEREVNITAEDGFGERDGDRIEKFSEKEFRKHGVTPRKGEMVEINGKQGRILLARSGRVTVDFNHPLAGKDLSYDVEVLEEIDDVERKVERLCADAGVEGDVACADNTCTIGLPTRNEQLEEVLDDRIREFTGIDTVRFEAEKREESDAE